MLYIFTYTVAT